jgi:hypothetical protein
LAKKFARKLKKRKKKKSAASKSQAKEWKYPLLSIFFNFFTILWYIYPKRRILRLEVSGMGFKDLPGGSNSKQNQSAAEKTTAQQAPVASNSPQKQEAPVNSTPS